MDHTRREFVKKVSLGTAGISLGSISIGSDLGGAASANSRIMEGAVSDHSGIMEAQVYTPKKRPNIVFICSDQHNPKYAGFMGHPLVKTPNLDKIARHGVVFTDTYCGAPVCVAGRSSMMTGMFSSDCNSFCNSTVWDGSYPTWGTLLGKAGYYCRAVGKLDLNHTIDCGFDQGTDHSHSISPGTFSFFRRPPLYNPDRSIFGRSRDNRHSDFEKLGKAMKFLSLESQNYTTPWALYVGFTQPHPPHVALKEYYDMYPAGEIDMPVVPTGHLESLHPVMHELRRSRELILPFPENNIRTARAAYYGMISELDEYIGKIWSELDRTGQLSNTIFVYTSDHGESLGEHGLWSKINPYDCATRVPLIISGPGLSKGLTINKPVAHVDLVATLLDMTGTELPSDLRGHSLIPLMKGKPGSPSEFALSQCHDQGNITGSFVIRKGDWKYIHFTWYDGLLFNIADDPGELNNLIDNPDVSYITTDLKRILYSQLDPEEVTLRAFRTQENKLNELANSMTEEELVKFFSRRMSVGQAKVMVSQVKSRI